MNFTTGFVVRSVARVSLLISSDVHYIVFTVYTPYCFMGGAIYVQARVNNIRREYLTPYMAEAGARSSLRGGKRGKRRGEEKGGYLEKGKREYHNQLHLIITWSIHFIP